MNEPAIFPPHGTVDQTNPNLMWTLKAGVWYCFVEGYKIFELKQGVGKWTISGLGRVHVHDVALDPEAAKVYALDWFRIEVKVIQQCLD